MMKMRCCAGWTGELLPDMWTCPKSCRRLIPVQAPVQARVVPVLLQLLFLMLVQQGARHRHWHSRQRRRMRSRRAANCRPGTSKRSYCFPILILRAGQHPPGLAAGARAAGRKRWMISGKGSQST